MTEKEEQELKRLEVNTQRLLQLVREQSAKIAHLEANLLRAENQRSDLERQLEKLRKEHSTREVALDLKERLHNTDLDIRSYLTEIIDEIKKSIAQLEQL